MHTTKLICGPKTSESLTCPLQISYLAMVIIVDYKVGPIT